MLSLTPTSFIVLGLVERLGEATPYELKATVAASVGNFWSVPHSAVYAESERLARAGYLEERREEGGRRRRSYSLTDRGRRALDDWRRDPTADLRELRDLALLKTFFGADPSRVAATQLPAHREKLAHYESVKAFDDGSGARGPWLALEAGIRHEREWIDYWERLAEEAPAGAGSQPRERAAAGG